MRHFARTSCQVRRWGLGDMAELSLDATMRQPLQNRGAARVLGLVQMGETCRTPTKPWKGMQWHQEVRELGKFSLTKRYDGRNGAETN